MSRIIHYLSDKYLAAWVVLLSDAALVFIAYIVATILRYNFEIQLIEFDQMMVHAVLTSGVYVITFFFSKSSTSILRHSGLNDLIRVFNSSLIACLILVVIASAMLYGYGYRGFWLIPKSVLIIQFLLASFLLSFSRIIAKATYGAFLRNNSDLKTNIVIFGAGESGRVTCQTLKSGRSNPKEIKTVVCFMDDHKSLQGKTLEGLPIQPPSKILNEDFILKNNIAQVIISAQNMSATRRAEITDQCLLFGLEVKEVPPYDKWIHGELSVRQIKPMSIENLLGRSEISLESQNIEREIRDKTILVTGGAGSIGSEIVRQLLHFHPRQVLVLDQAETPLHDLQIRLKKEFKDRTLWDTKIADVNDAVRMRSVFKEFKPDLVFHAAAYKHVPLMEANPLEAVKVNLLGTRCTADLAAEFGVKKFVLISTDKAVNPTNIMGATKRISEMYVQSLNLSQTETNFIITRFGNVLGSSGSVIPLFQNQIENGGPITVTHEEVTRYFMTVSEACNLVLEAGSMGKEGEIFVFDMGQPVRIYDLAKKMIQLSGFQNDADIKIEFTGLRPGEKLYEEVLANEENTIPTHHEKILKANISIPDLEKLAGFISNLEHQLGLEDVELVVSSMKNLIPQFVSSNSEFEALDLKHAPSS